jgi:hypothetical protein
LKERDRLEDATIEELKKGFELKKATIEELDIILICEGSLLHTCWV